ncbi:MAG: antibiotic biosynthesis monooxygenase [Alphaproteobacteria bacterium]|nr:antibiotic biosynthesis monooxygenase [Alphaproteobacteria bacterium]
MILITGSILARPDTLDALREAGIEHSRRSRAEPGCLAHNIHVDCENPLRLVFVERWKDRDAVAAHFKVKASVDFVVSARKLAAASPEIEILDTQPAKIG